MSGISAIRKGETIRLRRRRKNQFEQCAQRRFCDRKIEKLKWNKIKNWEKLPNNITKNTGKQRKRESKENSRRYIDAFIKFPIDCFQMLIYIIKRASIAKSFVNESFQNFSLPSYNRKEKKKFNYCTDVNFSGLVVMLFYISWTYRCM